MRSVRRSLLELAEHAAQRGVRLGLENRLRYHDIPLPDELDELLDLGLGDVVGYWHDIGHAQVLEHLGFQTHEEWLRRFAGPEGRLIGVHLHDVVGVTDHLAAGLGQVDWEMVAGYFPVGIKVVYLTGDAIRMKRKWRRDIDYRKKYEPTYFRNRYFRGQFLMAQKCYRPQMQVCDLVVDTTGAAIWATPEIAEILKVGQ